MVLKEQTGIEQKFGEAEIKQYVDEVTKEVRKRHSWQILQVIVSWYQGQGHIEPSSAASNYEEGINSDVRGFHCIVDVFLSLRKNNNADSKSAPPAQEQFNQFSPR